MVTSEAYEEYKREYDSSLSRIRNHLARSNRDKAIMIECDRLLSDAKRCATAMQAMAEIEGNAHGIDESKKLLQRDIAPLAKEISRQLNKSKPQTTAEREELFYNAPNIESSIHATNTGSSDDMESLIQNSDDMLRESRSILAETEEIGTRTLQQMGRQREQMENANQNLSAIQTVAIQAKNVLGSMAFRAWKSKVTLYCMIAALMAANGYVLYLIHKKHTKK
mmetsp:Transcript_30113/g.82734  ORF Transcript_30113/g.82734 Transcript_30113/m.82734 type:complete len:223 (-) Transcript_30113:1037-1705(-)|eukprot:CAMPEP_0168846452 /NCGR_PEP_ID=MMETSP0727-20121128/9805_1 /TAXON_ID=265536 /ORGANISM="Amphiprora sp., Strain CCMP467" /LENGTH=222 /DNA_ID=CAMNT_0008900217 /DNA_START=35 /DNA_END=703 /DNA_ORIENTATION=-